MHRIFKKKICSDENLLEPSRSNSESVTHHIPHGKNDSSLAAAETNKSTRKKNIQQIQHRPRPVFHCQQAHGSPTGIISDFTNVKELYTKIAECYEISVDEILFCTLNTHKIDMSKLLGGQIGLDDFIFVHVRGTPKEVEVTKSHDALGLTITDNGHGQAFIKRIRQGSIMEDVPFVDVGDLIEKIDGESMLGFRHFQVAKKLREIPKGVTFLLRTVEPMKSGFSNIGPSSGRRKSQSYGSGKETLRLRSIGSATIEIPDDLVNLAVDKINGLLESFLGINDADLAMSIWEMGSKADNPYNFIVMLDESNVKEFGFSHDLMSDFWGAISDAKSGRLDKVHEFSEQF